ncbi:NAD(P)H-hydrate dehydratase [Sphingomonas sp. KRR8]|uniref:NAD(P)H-hydrate dehydratase n=1 Tax=Sphingomonas sp. KRR8 TaxID=2942996 RepID=UPI00202141A7|nr:NAD(P)H-hydrate dehydratase [Sphingomonas sp. KRR8]URD60518.1 NAD(P)H-hydrate dehydratase [Sphingomonas sp. KRR8]
MSVTELDAALLAKHPLPAVGQGDKDQHGAILIIAGSRDVAGAALLTAMGAMRAGAGRLQIATVRSAASGLAFTMPEAMVVGFEEDADGGFVGSANDRLARLAGKADAVVAGPGLQQTDACAALAAALLKNGNRLALDAALLHALPARTADAKAAEIPPILLPHAGEMASLLECETAEVEADPLGAGLRCAKRYDAVTLVKGVQSHVVTPDGRAFRYRGGGPGLGVSGSGDMLAGIVGGLLARGAAPLTALLWGVWCHGEAGRQLGERIGTLGYLARELADEVPALLFPVQAPA